MRRLLRRVDDRFEHARNHQPVLLLLEVAIEDGDIAHLAVDAARLAVDLQLEERRAVDPYRARPAILHRQLQGVGVAAFNLCGAGQCQLRTLFREIYERTVEFLPSLGLLGFLRRIGLDVVAIQEWAHFPAGHAVINLDRGLILEPDL